MNLEVKIQKLRMVLIELQNQKRKLALENEKLLEKINDQHKTLTEKNKIIEQLNNQNAILKLSQNNLSDSDKKAFEKKIDKYLKLIDDTIHTLHH